MHRLVRVVLELGLLALLSMGSALAQNQDGNSQGEDQDGDRPRTSSATHSVPEFAPAAAGTIAVLVAGGGVLVTRRRRR